MRVIEGRWADDVLTTSIGVVTDAAVGSDLILISREAMDRGVNPNGDWTTTPVGSVRQVEDVNGDWFFHIANIDDDGARAFIYRIHELTFPDGVNPYDKDLYLLELTA